MGECVINSTVVRELESLLHKKLQEKNLSPSEIECFQKWVDDPCLRRCLQANDFMNLPKDEVLEVTAEHVFATIRWRASFKTNEINPVELAQALRCGESYMSPGKGKLGQPIFIYMKKPTNEHYFSNYVKASVYLMEEAIRSMDRDCKMEKWIVLSDLRNWTPQNMMPLHLARELVQILQNHYRERLYRVYVTNAPWYFHATWNMLKPLMDPDTRQKIQFISNNEQNMWECFQEDIDRSQLETHFGGNLNYSFNFGRDVLGLSPSESAALQSMISDYARSGESEAYTKNALIFILFILMMNIFGIIFILFSPF